METGSDRTGGAEPSEACRRDWPADPADPRIGIYALERVLRPDYYSPEYSEAFYRFDGSTVTRRVVSGYTHSPGCTYGWPTDVPDMALVQMHAHVTDDGWLYALMPCYGWHRLGRFVDREHLETALFARLRRLDVGDHAGLQGSPWNEARVAELFACLETYEADGEAIPLLPEEAR